MTGGLLSLICYGCDDLYLTGTPEITFFKIVYRRYTNFSIESIEVGINNNINFGDEYEVIIPRIGDAISKTYLYIKIPETYFTKKELGITDNSSVYDTVYITEYELVKHVFKQFSIAYKITTDKYQYVSSSKTIREEINNTIDLTKKDLYNALIAKYKGLYNATGISKSEKNKRLNDYILLDKINIYKLTENIGTTPYESRIDNMTPTSLYTLMFNRIYSGKRCQTRFFNKYQEYLNQTKLDTNGNLKFAWIEKLAHNIIDTIKITIGGETIDLHTGDYFNAIYDLNDKHKLDNLYNEMIGNIDTMTTYDTNKKPEMIIKLPLHFWFCNNYASSYPLIAARYTDIAIKTRFKSINQCAIVEKNDSINYTLEDIWNDKKYKLECSYFIDYIYLDGLERRKFAQSAHEYLIETTQIQNELLQSITIQNNITKYNNNNTPISNIKFGTVDFNVKLDFKHPCKCLLWHIQKNIYRTNKNGTKKCIFNNYTTDTQSGINPFTNTMISFNGYSKIKMKVGSSMYYNYLEPYAHDYTAPSEGINCYYFCLKRYELQPSGTANMSRISNQLLSLSLNEKIFYYYLSDIDPSITRDSDSDSMLNYTDLYFTCFAINYNILRFSGGYASLAFSF